MSLVSTTCAGDGDIRTFELEGDALTPRATTAVGKGVSAMALLPDGRRAFASTKKPEIAHLALDAEAGAWTVVGSTPTKANMTYLHATPDERFLLGANYAEGYGEVWPVTADGLGEATAHIEFRNLHCVITVGRHAYFVSLGEDLIACYELGDDGSLTPLQQPTLAAPEGSGPRHLIARPDGTHLYCITEFSGEVLHLLRDPETGVLSLDQVVTAHATDRGLTHSRFGADPVAEHLIWGADLHLCGGHLVASERCESTLSVLPVHADGSLGEQVCIADTEKQPRGFVVTGDLVIAPGEKSDHISLFRLDPDGQLHLLDRQPNGAGANWARVTG